MPYLDGRFVETGVTVLHIKQVTAADWFWWFRYGGKVHEGLSGSPEGAAKAAAQARYEISQQACREAQARNITLYPEGDAWDLERES